MSVVVVQILVILLLILANGLFAMAEIAIISSRKARLRQRADEGDRDAIVALDLAESPNRFLSTVQVGITLIGILAGALGGAALADPLGTLLARIKWLAPYSHSVALVLVVLVITYLSLVLGELVPKRLALNNPEAIALRMARPMRAVWRLASPVVRLLSHSTEGVLRLLGVEPSDEPPITEEEIKILLEEGTQAGIFQEVEQDMVEGVLLLDARRAVGLMTPRPEVVWLDLEDSAEKLIAKMTESPYSRFPVGLGSLDHILGEVGAKDLLAQSLRGEPLHIESVLKQPLYVPETTPALNLLESFKKTGTQLAFVIDEYGSMQGLVTLTDLLESIVGDIPSADEPEEPQAVQRADGSWLVDGLLPIDQLKDLFEIAQLPDELQGFYQTLGGFVLMQLGHVPLEAEVFRWASLQFEVVDMDGPRVDKVLVTPASLLDGASPES